MGLSGIDLLFVAVASSVAGGTDSPFLGQCYLIIFSSSLLYGLAGGMGAGTMSAIITEILALPSRAGLWEAVRDKKNSARRGVT